MLAISTITNIITLSRCVLYSSDVPCFHFSNNNNTRTFCIFALHCSSTHASQPMSGPFQCLVEMAADYLGHLLLEEDVLQPFVLYEQQQQPHTHSYTDEVDELPSISILTPPTPEPCIFSRCLAIPDELRGMVPSSCERITVELHAHDYQHPVAQMFCVPLFFLVGGTDSQHANTPSECHHLLSILTTAVSSLQASHRITINVRDAMDPYSILASPYTFHCGCAPCFAPVGEAAEQIFTGLSPPSSHAAGMAELPSAAQVRTTLHDDDVGGRGASTALTTHFRAALFPNAPPNCQDEKDLLSLFHHLRDPTQVTNSHTLTHMQRSSGRVRDVFVSIRKRFSCAVAPTFSGLFHPPRRDGALATLAGAEELTWKEVVERENAATDDVCGRQAHAFGTTRPPIHRLVVTAEWSCLPSESVPMMKNAHTFDPLRMSAADWTRHTGITAQAMLVEESAMDHVALTWMRRTMEQLWSPTLVWPDSSASTSTCVGEEDEASFAVAVLTASPGRSSSFHNAVVRALMEEEEEEVMGVYATEAPRMMMLKDLRRAYFPGSLLSRFAHRCVEECGTMRDTLCRRWRACLAVLHAKMVAGGTTNLAYVVDAIGLPAMTGTAAVDLTQTLLMQKIQLLAYCLQSMLRAGEELPDHGRRSSALLADEDLSRAVPDAELGTATGMRLITHGEVLRRPPPLPHIPTTSDQLLRRSPAEGGASNNSSTMGSTAVEGEALFMDMCLFQWANAVACGRVVRFADFVQWHSPRDFVMPATPSMNDNDYVSHRMQCKEGEEENHVWWALWRKARPRSQAEVMADAFRPAEVAEEVFRWLMTMVSERMLRVEVFHASLANLVHRIVSHRHVIGERSLTGGRPHTCKDGAQAHRSPNPRLRAFMAHHISQLSAVLDSVTAVMLCDRSTEPSDVELHMMASGFLDEALRIVADMDSALCCAIAVEHMLLGTLEATPAMMGLVRRLSSPKYELSPLRMGVHDLPRELWLAMRGEREMPSGLKFSPHEATAVRVTAMVSEPGRGAPRLQQLVGHKDVDGGLRLAFAISEEVGCCE